MDAWKHVKQKSATGGIDGLVLKCLNLIWEIIS